MIHHLIDLELPNYINYNLGNTRGHDYKLSYCALKFSFSHIVEWNSMSNLNEHFYWFTYYY